MVLFIWWNSRPSPVYLFDHWFFDINMDFIYHINCIHILLKELYAVFGNLIIVFLPWSSVLPLLSVRGSSPLWIALNLCWGTPLARKIYMIWCLLHVMALPKEFLPDLLSDWYLVMVVFTWTGTRKKIPQCADENWKIKMFCDWLWLWVSCKYVEGEERL